MPPKRGCKSHIIKCMGGLWDYNGPERRCWYYKSSRLRIRVENKRTIQVKETQKRAHIIYSGSVQGVGFRFTAESMGNSLGLTGWVKNCPNGTVEVVCEGKEGDIQEFMDKIKDAFGHYIHSAKVERKKATGEFDAFGIKLYH